MTAVVAFPGSIVRAIVVEQLNRQQWNAVLQGDAPAGSLEAQAGSVVTFAGAIKEAIRIADLTGLPLLVAPYQRPAEPLSYAGSSHATWQWRFRHAINPDRILNRSPGWDGAA